MKKILLLSLLLAIAVTPLPQAMIEE